MFVDLEMFLSGAADSGRAARHAQAGGDQLAGARLPAGMFGDLAAAHDFCRALAEVHTRHIERSRSHRDVLNETGRRARRAVAGFITMEQRHAAAAGAVVREAR